MRRVAGTTCAALAGAALLASAPPLQAQAYRVKDINSGAGHGVGSLAPDEAVAVGSILYFTGDDGAHGIELWRSDGTDGGTFLVRDINPGPSASSPRELTRVGSLVFFRANDGVHNDELWRSDGTAAGTFLVRDINPGAASSFAAPPLPQSRWAVVGSTVFFAANDGVHGEELWKSDGTAAGTTLVKDVGPFSSVRWFRPFAGALYFCAITNQGVAGTGGLWRSDGTETGTVLVKLFPGEPPLELTEFGGWLYFGADDGGHGPQLWRTDGTTAGTVLFKTVNPPNGALGGFGIANGRLFFNAYHNLWMSDGTAPGTTLVKDFTAIGGQLIDPNRYAGLAGLTFFGAMDPVHRTELWRTDGTSAGTFMLKDIGPAGYDGLSGGSNIVSAECALYFPANDLVSGAELWTTDSTAAGTVVFQEIGPGAAWSNAAPVLRIGSLLYLRADDGLTGRELWAFDVVNECPLASFTVDSSTTPEGPGAHSVAVSVTTPLGTAMARPVSVSYATASGTATVDADYTSTTGTLTFPAGSASGTLLNVPVTILADLLDEDDETVLVSLSSALGGTLIAPATHTITIADDDPLPAIAIDDVQVGEGNDGETLATFIATLSAPSGRLVTASYATADGSATAGLDYGPSLGTVVFAAGSVAQTLRVAVIGDRVFEGAETFTVGLAAPHNVVLPDPEGEATILDDDPAGLSVADVAIVEPVAGSRSARFTVTLSPTSAGPVTVEYSTTGVTATPGDDYDETSGVLSFDPGVSTRPVDVAIHADSSSEGGEQFVLDLANASGAAIAYGQAVGSIYDPGSYFSVVPCRVLDTRGPTGPLGGPPLVAGETRTITLAGSCGIPASAHAVSLNVTVTQPGATGNLRLFPAGDPVPSVSSLNYSAGQTRANNAVAGLNAAGALAIHVAQGSGTVHVIVDVSGYFE